MIVLVVVSLLAIQPNITNVNGAQVVYMPVNSYIGNLSSRGVIGLQAGSIITSVDGIPVHNIQQFYSQLNKSAIVNTSLSITYENEIFPYIFKSNTTKVFVEPNTVFNSSTIQAQNVPYTHLNYGLDIIGGTQIEVVPNSTNYNTSVISELETTLSKRLDVYGISGTTVTTVQALSGKSFIMVSMPNVGESQALSLIQNQGKFYATIGNFTVFNSSNSSESILDVCLFLVVHLEFIRRLVHLMAINSNLEYNLHPVQQRTLNWQLNHLSLLLLTQDISTRGYICT